jgi:hypothetical protein
MLRRPFQFESDMHESPARLSPSTMEICGWAVDALIVIALCIATFQAHRVAFGFFALFAAAGWATRAHWTGTYVLPSRLRLSIALLYISSCAMLLAAEFDLLSAPITTVARWGFVAASALVLGARIAGWRSAETTAANS